MKKSLFPFFVITLLCATAAYAQRGPEWLKNAVIYHIYPSSFQDSDGDGIGDLEGIRSRLDYVKACGFNTIWLSPVFESPFEDGGYDITDYYKVDPRFGTNTQLVELIRDAHAKGIRICLDLVAGHTSDKHPWFRQSRSADTNLQYSDYYIWSDSKSSLPTKKFVKSDAPRNGNFLKNYFEVQPALNYGYAHPDPDEPWQQGYDDPGPRAVRQEIRNIMAFWMDKGVDGFRCDMAMSLVKNDDRNHTATVRLWHEMREWIDARYPECILISEWSQPGEAIPAGFHVDLIIHNGAGYDMYSPLVCNTDDKNRPTVCYFDRAGEGQIRSFVDRYTKERHATREQGYLSMPTCSHDIWRLNRNQRNTPEELKVTMTFFLLMPWIPTVYYGEEIGMRNIEDAPIKEGSFGRRNRSSCRTPMQWDASPNAGFTTGEPWIMVNPNYTQINAAQQVNDPDSVFCFYQQLLRLRKQHDVFLYGTYELMLPDSEAIWAYRRTLGGRQAQVYCNFTTQGVPCETPREGLLLCNYNTVQAEILRPCECRVYLDPKGLLRS